MRGIEWVLGYSQDIIIVIQVRYNDGLNGCGDTIDGEKWLEGNVKDVFEIFD